MNQWERASIWFNLCLELPRNWWAQSRSSIICFINWAHQYERHWATNINQAIFPAVCVSVTPSVCCFVDIVLGKGTRLTAHVCCCLPCGQWQGQVSLLGIAFIETRLLSYERLLLHRDFNRKYCWANLLLGFPNLAFPTQATTWPPGRAWEFVYSITSLSFTGWTGIHIPPLSKQCQPCEVLMSLTSSCLNAMKKGLKALTAPLVHWSAHYLYQQQATH